ncbi:MAG: DUF1574 domain-containing protein [Desulfocapsa sp.]|nr:DUF1574 domain-containing protein [Desulfocapsa sp.]
MTLCCGIYLLLFYLQFGASVVAEWWVRDVYWVKDSIADNIHDKKVVVISGSNSLFGLDGEALEKETGLPVVNMAGHGGLDLDFYRFKIDQIVGSGDIVIIPLEPEYYSRNNPYSKWFLDNMMAWGKDYFFSLSLIDGIRFVFHAEPERVIEGVRTKLFRKEIDTRKDVSREALLLSAKKIWDGDASAWSGYNYKSIDRYGGINVVGGPTRNAVFEISSYRSYFHDIQLSDYFIDKYFEIKTLVEKKGAKVYLIWSVTGKNKKFNLFDVGEQQRLIGFASQLQEKGIDIYCNPASFYFHKDLFFNTGYHLNSLGTIVRTENLADCLADIDNNLFRGAYDFETVLQKVQHQEKVVKKVGSPANELL